MTCSNLIGVKNILMTFYDCDLDITVGPIVHALSSEELPTWRLAEFNNERMPGGYTKRKHSDAKCQIKVIRDLRIPLEYYQGSASINLQVEYENGLVYTGVAGGVIGEEMSDTHEVSLDLSFNTLDELLPAGSLAA